MIVGLGEYHPSVSGAGESAPDTILPERLPIRDTEVEGTDPVADPCVEIVVMISSARRVDRVAVRVLGKRYVVWHDIPIEILTYSVRTFPQFRC